MSNGKISQKSPASSNNGDAMATVVGARFYGDNWGKPRLTREPQGANGECIVKVPADPDKLAKYKAELAALKQAHPIKRNEYGRKVTE